MRSGPMLGDEIKRVGAVPIPGKRICVVWNGEMSNGKCGWRHTLNSDTSALVISMVSR